MNAIGAYTNSRSGMCRYFFSSGWGRHRATKGWTDLGRQTPCRPHPISHDLRAREDQILKGVIRMDDSEQVQASDNKSVSAHLPTTTTTSKCTVSHVGAQAVKCFATPELLKVSRATEKLTCSRKLNCASSIHLYPQVNNFLL